MEKFQKDVANASHNNGNNKTKNNVMDAERADLWKQSRIKLSKKDCEYNEGCSNSGPGRYSS